MMGQAHRCRTEAGGILDLDGCHCCCGPFLVMCCNWRVTGGNTERVSGLINTAYQNVSHFTVSDHNERPLLPFIVIKKEWM